MAYADLLTDPALLAHYKLDEADGASTIVDSSGNANDLAVVESGSITRTSVDAPLQALSAMRFVVTGGTFSGFDPAAHFIPDATDVTIAAWIRLNVITGQALITVKSANFDGVTDGIRVNLSTATYWGAALNKDGPSLTRLRSGTNNKPVINFWYAVFVTMVYSTAVVKPIIFGVLPSTSSMTPLYGSVIAGNGTYKMNADLSNMMIFTKVLSDAEMIDYIYGPNSGSDVRGIQQGIYMGEHGVI